MVTEARKGAVPVQLLQRGGEGNDRGAPGPVRALGPVTSRCTPPGAVPRRPLHRGSHRSRCTPAWAVHRCHRPPSPGWPGPRASVPSRIRSRSATPTR